MLGSRAHDLRAVQARQAEVGKRLPCGRLLDEHIGHLNPEIRQYCSACCLKGHARTRRMWGACWYLAVVLRPLPAAPLVVRRRYLAVVPRPLPAAPLVMHRRYLVVMLRPFPAAPLIARRRYLAVVPRPLSAAPLVVHRSYLIVVPRPMPAAPSSYLVLVLAVAPRPLSRHRSLCVAGT